MCLSELLCQCWMSRNEDNVSEWTVVSVPDVSERG